MKFFVKFIKYLALFLFVCSLVVYLFDPMYGGLLIGNNQNKHQIKIGKVIYEKHQCANCHGVDGIAIEGDHYPHIAGQKRLYVQDQLHGFKARTRVSSYAETMYTQLLEISDDEIVALSYYIESL